MKLNNIKASFIFENNLIQNGNKQVFGKMETLHLQSTNIVNSW
jgi:hypothetical protein